MSEIEYLTYDEYLGSFTNKANEYHKKNLSMYLIGKLTDPVILVAIVFLGITGIFNENSPFTSEYSFLSVLWTSVWLITLIFILGVPFSYYSERIEKNYEFSTLTWKKWIWNQIKAYLISVIIFSLLIEAIYSALHFTGDLWWIWAFAGYFVFAGILQALAPILLIPLFTKMTSLPEGELRTRMENLADSMDIKYKDIYLWHLSDQSTKANAAVMGFGPTTRIVLGDTLVENFRIDEIEVVMTHEISHQKSKDIYRGTLFTGIISLIAFIVIEQIFKWAIPYFGFTSRSDPATIGLFVASLMIILELMSVLSLWHTRVREKVADLLAISKIPDMQIYESAFARLAKQNLSYPNPSKLEIVFRYSHPPIEQRIAYAREYLVKLNLDNKSDL
jgi:STE24 endopeptidase